MLIEKAAKKRAEKKAEEEKAAEKRAERPEAAYEGHAVHAPGGFRRPALHHRGQQYAQADL